MSEEKLKKHNFVTVLSPPFFCVGIQEAAEELDAAVAAAGGVARFGMDDGFVVGPPHVVFPAIERFKARLKSECGLEIVDAKGKVLCTNPNLDLTAMPCGMRLAGKEKRRWCMKGEMGWRPVAGAMP